MAAFTNLAGVYHSGTLIVCTLILICVVEVVCGGGCQQKRKWYQPRAFALTGTYRNQTSKAVMRCASSCLQNDACKSFKYCEDDEICQLNSAVQSDNITALKPSSRCVYYEDKFQDAWKYPPRQVARTLKHVSIGEAGVWGIGVQNSIYYRGRFECTWTLIPGVQVLKQLDVGMNVVWGVAPGNGVFYRTVSDSKPEGTSWSKTSGGLQQVSVSQKGHAWGVINNLVYHRTGVSSNSPGGISWKFVTTGLKQISVGSGGVWGITPTNKILYRVGTYGDPDSDTDGSDWEKVEPLDISLKYVSSGDVIYVVDANDAIYYRVGTSAETPTGTKWQQIDGSLKQIESISETFWGVDAENNVYTNQF